MKLTNIITTKYTKSMHSLAGSSKPYYTASMFGMDFKSETKTQAIEMALQAFKDQAENEGTCIYRWAPSGAIFRLFFHFGWAYEIVHPGKTHASTCILSVKTRSEALDQMETHCNDHDCL